ncbi:MAG: hypothetical protein Q9218_001393 [Villophora microphyllina]
MSLKITLSLEQTRGPHSMGVCSSCLGRRRQRDVEDPETSRLLSDDPYRSYGSRNPNARPAAPQPDPESVRREREALENIAHGMSEDVVDIFTVLPEVSKDGESQPLPLCYLLVSQLIVTRDRSGPPIPQTNGFSGDDIEAQQMACRTIKRGNIEKISSRLSSSKHDWKDAKAALG